MSTAPAMMSNAPERTFLRATSAEAAALSFKKGLHAVAHTLRRGAVALGHGVADAINAQAENRARDRRYSTRLW